MRPEKQLLLDEIKDKIDNSSALFITRYTNLNPNLSSSFRLELGKTGGSFEVVRKRILIKAAQAAGFSLDLDALPGHIGVVFAHADPVQLTKAIYEFKKSNEEVLDVVSGRFEGQLCSANDVEAISKLPGKDEMRAQLIAVLEAPMSQTLAVIESLLSSVMHCLENKSQENQEN